MSGGSQTQTTRTEPWDAQKDYLKTGFARAEDLYSTGKMTPAYYSGTRIAPFDPATLEAQRSALTYATGPRPANLQAGAETTQLGGLQYGRDLMDYGTAMRSPMSGAEYANLTPFTDAQYSGLLSGEVDTSVFDPLADAYRSEVMGQLTGEILPGIRSQIVQYQPGGSTRGDIIQANAVAAANQRVTDNLGRAMFDAYNQAQGRRMGAAQMGLGAQQFGIGQGATGAGIGTGYLGQYPTIMSAPLTNIAAMDKVGQQRQAMEQRGIQAALDRYAYESQLPTIGLQNYLAAISGDYGSNVTATGPSGPSPLVTALAGGAGLALGGPAGAALFSGAASAAGQENNMPQFTGTLPAYSIMSTGTGLPSRLELGTEAYRRRREEELRQERLRQQEELRSRPGYGARGVNPNLLTVTATKGNFMRENPRYSPQPGKGGAPSGMYGVPQRVRGLGTGSEAYKPAGPRGGQLTGPMAENPLVPARQTPMKEEEDEFGFLDAMFLANLVAGMQGGPPPTPYGTAVGGGNKTWASLPSLMRMS